MSARIYADHAATTPLHPEVREEMLPWLSSDGIASGNASSLYFEGRASRQAIDEARERLARAAGSHFAEVVLTSGGTEAANLAIVGSALHEQGGSRHKVVVSAAEHHCVLQTADHLQKLGFEMVIAPTDRYARVDRERLCGLLDDSVLLVAVMQANNELGTWTDLEPIVQFARNRGVRTFVDCVQSFAYFPVDFQDSGIDFASVSGHKRYGPQGSGALLVRSGVKLYPLLVGGGQERELRAGTENVAAIVGLGAASQLPGDGSKVEQMRDHFFATLDEQVNGWSRTVPPEIRTLPGHAHLRFPGIPAEALLIRLDRMGVSAGSGSACSSGSVEPSHVLLAAGFDAVEAAEGLRLTFGRTNTLEEAREAALRLSEAVCAVRESGSRVH